MYVGIDLGQRRVHVVVLDRELRLASSTIVDVADLDSLREHLEDAEVVAIDAPEGVPAFDRSG